MKRIFAFLLALVLVMTLIPMTMAGAESTATVVGGWLRLRALPSLNATILSSYYTGTVITLLDGPSNNWYHVRTPDNLVGYMVADYLSLGGTPTGNAYVVNPSGNNVNLRKGPGTGYPVIRDFAVGTPVTVLSYGSVWSRVSIYGYTGYMMTTFIGSSSPSPTPTPVCYATIWSANGYGVRLRSGPGKNYSSKGSYAVGTKVAVLQKGAVWDYISVGSRTGWMMNEFLIYNGEKQLTSVGLNNYYPYVGDELYALSIAPVGATVSYQWFVGGVLAGTDSTYVVQPQDEGKLIYLTVVGVGSYTGSVTSSCTHPVSGQYFMKGVELSNNAPVVGDTLYANYTPAAASVTYEWFSGDAMVSTASAYQVSPADVGKRIYVRVTGIAPYHGTVYSMKSAAVASTQSLLSVSIGNTTSIIRGIFAPAVGDTLRALYAPLCATVNCQWMRDGSPISGETGLYYTLTDADLGHVITVVVTGTGSYHGSLWAGTGKVVEKPIVPEIKTESLPYGVVCMPYYFQLESNVKNAIWKLAGGYTLPEGLSFANGIISGLPVKAGSTTVKFIVSNEVGESSKEFVLTVNEKLVSLLNIDWDSITDASVNYASDEAGIISQLPSTVGIVTNTGAATAKLHWVLSGFDASKTTGYQLQATAKMTVPEGVVNTFHLPEEKTVTLQVGALPSEPLQVSIGSDVTNPIPANTPVTLTASVSGGIPPYHYQWEVSGSDEASIVYNMPNSSASISLTVTDSASHTASSSIGLTLMKPMEAVLVATPSGAVNPGDEVLLEVQATEGSGVYTYLWGDESTEAFRLVYPMGDTLYSVTVSDGYSTMDLEITVNVTPPMTLSYEAPQEIPEEVPQEEMVEEIPQEIVEPEI